MLHSRLSPSTVTARLGPSTPKTPTLKWLLQTAWLPKQTSSVPVKHRLGGLPVASEVEASEVEASEVEASEVEASEIEASEVEASEVLKGLIQFG